MSLPAKAVKWTVHFYVGNNERPLLGTMKQGYFKSRSAVMRAAQNYYRRLLCIWANDPTLPTEGAATDS